MGYMGFGLKKEAYSRKPKRIFEREKELYGEHLEKYPKIIKNKNVEHYLSELEAFKNEKRFKTKIGDAFLGMLMTLAIMFFILMMVMWLMDF